MRSQRAFRSTATPFGASTRRLPSAVASALASGGDIAELRGFCGKHEICSVQVNGTRDERLRGLPLLQPIACKIYKVFTFTQYAPPVGSSSLAIVWNMPSSHCQISSAWLIQVELLAMPTRFQPLVNPAVS